MTLSYHRRLLHDGLLASASGLAAGILMGALGTATTIPGYAAAFTIGSLAFLMASDFPHTDHHAR